MCGKLNADSLNSTFSQGILEKLKLKASMHICCFSMLFQCVYIIKKCIVLTLFHQGGISPPLEGCNVPYNFLNDLGLPNLMSIPNL